MYIQRSKLNRKDEEIVFDYRISRKAAFQW